MNRSGGEGFTLVELLVALLIFSVVMTTLFSSVITFLTSARTLTRETEQTEIVGHALARMARDLTAVFSLTPPQYRMPDLDGDPDPFGFTAGQESAGTAEHTLLSFSSLCRIPRGSHGKQGLARISYFVRENEDGLLNLHRSDLLQPMPDSPDEGPCPIPVLCPDITKFEAIFWDAGEESYTAWDSDAEELEYAFPVRVVLRIHYRVENTPRVLETGVSLPGGRKALK